jgi:hypothetical protein
VVKRGCWLLGPLAGLDQGNLHMQCMKYPFLCLLMKAPDACFALETYAHTGTTQYSPPAHLLHGDHLWRRVLFTLLPAQRDERGQTQIPNLDLACTHQADTYSMHTRAVSIECTHRDFQCHSHVQAA